MEGEREGERRRERGRVKRGMREQKGGRERAQVGGEEEKERERERERERTILCILLPDIGACTTYNNTHTSAFLFPKDPLCQKWLIECLLTTLEHQLIPMDSCDNSRQC